MLDDHYPEGKDFGYRSQMWSLTKGAQLDLENQTCSQNINTVSKAKFAVCSCSSFCAEKLSNKLIIKIVCSTSNFAL